MKRGPARQLFFGWLAAVLLLLALDPWWYRSVRIVPPVDRSLLNDGQVWQLPLALWSSATAISTIPYWLFAMLMAMVVSIVWNSARRRGAGDLIATCGLITVTMAARPQDLWPAAGLLLSSIAIRATAIRATAIRATARRSARWLPIVSGLLLLGWTTTTLEYGLLSLFVIRELLAAETKAADDNHVDRRKPGLVGRRLAVAGVLSLLAAASLMSPNFGRCLLRPVTAAVQSSILFPELNLLAGEFHAVAGRLACVVLVAILATRSFRSNPSLLNHCIDFAWATIAVCSSFYTVLVTIGFLFRPATRPSAVQTTSAPDHIAAKTASQPRSAFDRISRPVLVGTVVVVLVAWTVSLRTHGWNALGGSSYAAKVDPSQWSFAGTVLLTNLQQSRDWQREDIQEKFSLLRSGRWDAATQQAAAYRRAVKDLLTGRREFFLRANGSAGGYRDFLDQHDLVALVLETNQLDAVRQLSVDPVWRILSIDGSRVIFGRNDRPATTAATRRAGQLMLQMEWPGRRQVAGSEKALATGSAADARRIAGVLNAVRLPYAALRLVQQDTSAAAENIRTWSYTELAYRALRQAGRPSRIDDERARHGLRAIGDASLTSSQNRANALRALSGLRDASIQTHDVSDERSSAAANSLDDGAGNSGLHDLANLQASGSQRFRDLIRRSVIDEPAALSQAFAALASAASADTATQKEAWFYAGCLALEAGDSRAAIAHFNRFTSTVGPSAFSGLVTFYLSQLG